MNDSNDDGVFPTFSLEELNKLKELENLSKLKTETPSSDDYYENDEYYDDDYDDDYYEDDYEDDNNDDNSKKEYRIPILSSFFDGLLDILKLPEEEEEEEKGVSLLSIISSFFKGIPNLFKSKSKIKALEPGTSSPYAKLEPNSTNPNPNNNQQAISKPDVDHLTKRLSFLDTPSNVPSAPSSNTGIQGNISIRDSFNDPD